MVYVGGKKKLAKFICPFLQEELDSGKYQTYLEPFGGGGNIIENIKFDNRIFNDINKELIAFYKALQSGWKIPEPNSFDADFYNKVKKAWRENSKEYEDYFYGYMMFIPSYNGKMWGSFAKNGSRLYQKEHYESIINQWDKIKDCTFTSLDFENINIKNSVIYCDPPYKDSKKDYYNKTFNYEKFYDWCRKMSINNKIYISETQMPNDFKVIWQQEYKRTLANQAKAINTIEKLYII